MESQLAVDEVAATVTVTLLHYYTVTLLHCYTVTLLHCYIVTLCAGHHTNAQDVYEASQALQDVVDQVQMQIVMIDNASSESSAVFMKNDGVHDHM